MSPEQLAEDLIILVIKLIGYEALKEKAARLSQTAINEANEVADALEDAKFGKQPD